MMHRRFVAVLALLSSAIPAAAQSTEPDTAGLLLHKSDWVIFTAAQTLRMRPLTTCNPSAPQDTAEAWTPPESAIRVFETRVDSTLARRGWLPDMLMQGLWYRQYFGIVCGGGRKIQMIAVPEFDLASVEAAMTRPPGYGGPLWRALPLEYWADASELFALYDPETRTAHVATRVAWEHRVAPPYLRADEGRIMPGKRCIALGFGPWSNRGAEWLPLGWEERFPHLELRDSTDPRGGNLALAVHSPRPALPTLHSRGPLRDRLIFDRWISPAPDSLVLVRWIVLSDGIIVQGRWTGDTMRGSAWTGSDAVTGTEPSAHAFAVRYECGDAEAAMRAEAQVDALRRGAKKPQHRFEPQFPRISG
jgi:hypothetical protein